MPTWDSLPGIRSAFGSQMESAILDALKRLANPSAEVAALLEQGRLDAALDALPWTEAMSTLERRIYRIALQIQVRAAQQTVQRQSLSYRFDVMNPHAIRAAQQQAGDLIREVTVDTRLAVRDIVVRGQRDGVDVRDQAKLIRQHVGLTRRQATAVYNFRRGLEERGYAPEKVDRMTERRWERSVRERSITIARTEAIRAANSGKDELWRQAMVAGVVSPASRRVWVASPNACELCKPMNGKAVGINDHFPSGIRRKPDGSFREVPSVKGPPLHPRCRCSLYLEAA